MKPKLPNDVELILSRLKARGYRADIVGGCVRDFILGKKPYDYDVTTSARPEEIKTVFSDLKTLDVGIKHGTVTVIVSGVPYEVTTYRIESEYLDHRHPSRVDFTDKLGDDLGRRDFTMNAIAYNPDGGFTDLYCGRNDIFNKTIRAVGDAEVRFFEDALRILRAVRFASVLDFEIEEKTAAAALKMREHISSVSGERIAVEWKKALGGIGAYSAIKNNESILLSFLALDKIVLPPLDSFNEASPEMREIGMFFLSSDDPVRDFERSADRMKYDSARRKFAASVLGLAAENPTFADERAVQHLMTEYGADAVGGVIELFVMLSRAEKGALNLYRKILEENKPYRISDIKISGRELSEIGFRGADIGAELSKLLSLVIDGELDNAASSLYLAAKKHFDSRGGKG